MLLIDEMSMGLAPVIVESLLPAARAEKVAARVGGRAVSCDVGDPDAVAELAAEAARVFGPVEVFVSNAGFTDDPAVGVDGKGEDVHRIVDVNLLAHVWAAKAVLSSMIERGRGWLVQTISSAALITGPSGMGYTLSKHGPLGFAEWIGLNHGHQGRDAGEVMAEFLGRVSSGQIAIDESLDLSSVVVSARSPRGGERATSYLSQSTSGARWRAHRPVNPGLRDLEQLVGSDRVADEARAHLGGRRRLGGRCSRRGR